MESVALVVAALAAGAAAGLKPAAETAIKDAYAGFKALIQRRFGDRVDVTPIERSPESAKKREAVAEDLQSVQVDVDAEVVEAARALLELVRSRAPETTAAIGLDIGGLKAGSLDVEDVSSTGIGVRLRDTEVAGEARFRGIRAQDGSNRNP